MSARYKGQVRKSVMARSARHCADRFVSICTVYNSHLATLDEV